MSVESGVCISCDGSICSENRLRNGTRCLTPEREQTCHVSASCSKDDARGHMAGWRRIWCNLKLQWKKGATLIRLKKAEVKSAYERGRWGSCAKRNCSCFRTWGCLEEKPLSLFSCSRYRRTKYTFDLNQTWRSRLESNKSGLGGWSTSLGQCCHTNPHQAPGGPAAGVFICPKNIIFSCCSFLIFSC